MGKTLPATRQIVIGSNNEVKKVELGHFMICSVGLAVLNNFFPNFGGR